MALKVRYLLPAMAGLGFLAGFAVRQPPETESRGLAASERSRSGASRSHGDGGSAPGERLPVAVAGVKSADTLPELLEIGDADELYARLALWLLDAPEEDIAAFWSAYAGREKSQRDAGIIDLVFAQWTRIHPAAAIEAAKGSGHEAVPWWAWAIHDPDAAVAAVRGAPAEMAGFVMRAIGQFHPERALRVLEENPDFARWNAIEGIVNGLARSDPEAALDFQVRQGTRAHGTEAIEKLTRDDPHAALEWLRRHSYGNHRHLEEVFLNTLQRENPEMLVELAEELPPGRMRREVESAAFLHLAETDPAEALRQARDAASPRLAAERLAVLGGRMAADDFQGALGIFEELFEACPDAGGRTFLTRYPNGARGSGREVDGVQPFIDRLIAADPRATMEVAQGMSGADAGSSGRVHPSRDGSAAAAVANRWSRLDTDGFAGWLDTQEPGPEFDRGAAAASREYLNRRQYEEALAWSLRISDGGPRHELRHVFQQWHHHDAEAAGKWFEEAGLPDHVRQALEPYLSE